MQTLQLAEALYAQDDAVMNTDVYGHLKDLKSNLDGPLNKARAHWDTNEADAAARICPEGFLEVFHQMISTVSEVLLLALLHCVTLSDPHGVCLALRLQASCMRTLVALIL